MSGGEIKLGNTTALQKIMLLGSDNRTGDA